MNKLKEFFLKLQSNTYVSGVVFGIIIVLFIQFILTNNLNSKVAGDKVTNFVNNTLLGGKETVKLDTIVDLGGIYKLGFTISDKPVPEAYMSKDGKYFFPTGYPMASSTEEKKDSSDNKTSEITKSDKPKVELFVMSYCPYGTQIEKGIIPAVQALGDKIDFNLKFVNYAMHGKKELDENLRQYCINKEQNNKLFSYLSCFLKSDKSSECLVTSGIDQTKMNLCVINTDKQFKVSEQFTKKENWNGDFPPFDIFKVENKQYDVQGSPTLIINGLQVESSRDSASLLKTICGAFNTEPEVCNTAKLSSASPSAGFGDGTDTSGAGTADCATN